MMDEMIETFSTCVMLIPDQNYRRQRPSAPEIHLTLGYFGRHTFMDADVTELIKGVRTMAANLDPIEATANATGLFPEGESFALVELIDGIDTFYAREMLETMFGKKALFTKNGGPTLDYTHGFTPHVTLKYVTEEDIMEHPEIVIPSAPVKFLFDAIGVWHGPYHYDVAL